MTIPLIAAFGQFFSMLLLGFIAIILILLVLVQRGRGGGLAGALGGMGGSSAFGAKAGDVFTKVTVVVATLWIVLCIAATKMTPSSESLLDTKVTESSTSATDELSLGSPAGTTEETTDGATDGATDGSPIETIPADGVGSAAVAEPPPADAAAASTESATEATE